MENDAKQDLLDLVANFEAIATRETTVLAWTLHGLHAMLMTAAHRLDGDCEDLATIAALITRDMIQRMGITEEQSKEALRFAKLLERKAGEFCDTLDPPQQQ
jgi:hypothetical protein